MFVQRYFVEDKYFEGDFVTIENNDFHHIKNVMRLHLEDVIVVCNYSGQTFKAKIIEILKDSIVLKILEEIIREDNTMNLSIAQALIRKDNFELVLQKVTELGVSEFYPLETIRSIIKIDNFAKKHERYKTIAKEASEQSERTKPTVVNQLSTIYDLPLNNYDYVLVAYAREGNDHSLISQIRRIAKTKKVLVLIGPEGGFDDKEIEFLKSKSKLVSLGKTILRSETAAIFVASAFRYQWEA